MKQVGETMSAGSPQTESLLDVVLAATLEGIVDHDLLHGQTVYSARWKSLLGFDAEVDLPSSPTLWLDLSHEEDRAELEELWEGHIEQGWPFHHTWRMQHAHGGFRWVLCRSVVRLTDEGVPARALSLYADVTEEVEYHRRHTALVEAIPDTVLRIGTDGVIVDIRKGSSPNEAQLLEGVSIGDNVTQLESDELPQLLIELTHAAQREKSVQSLEWECDRDGRKHYFELRVTHCGEEEGVCVLRDTTELKVLETHLLQSQKLESIGQLAAGVAHEINTPTQYVGDNTQFLQDSFGELLPLLRKAAELAIAVQSEAESVQLAAGLQAAIDEADIDYLAEEIPQALEQSLTGIESISKIVRSMKEFSHPGETEMTPTDINRAIEGTLTVATGEWKYVAELERDFDTNLPTVPCLAAELNQVILNLVVNAAHAIGDVVGDGAQAKGRIKVSTQNCDEFAEIRISDTGGGIPSNIVDKIFDPFFTTKEVGKGTGQGLSIAYDVVVNKHSGSLTVETEVGQGTTFVIRLPFERHAEAA